jgi:hypothetical protein
MTTGELPSAGAPRGMRAPNNYGKWSFPAYRLSWLNNAFPGIDRSAGQASSGPRIQAGSRHPLSSAAGFTNEARTENEVDLFIGIAIDATERR